MNIYFKIKNYLDKECLVGHNIVIERELFFNNGKFYDILLEDVDLSARIKNKKIQSYIMSHCVETSARKYQKIGFIAMAKYWFELWLCKKYPKYSNYLKYNKYFDAR